MKTFLSAFDNSILRTGDDAAPLEMNGAELAVSTDAHVVTPLFFPGGDIGKLAVCGTVNDVAMLGARPLYLTAAFILEEGLPIETLQRVVASMKPRRKRRVCRSWQAIPRWSSAAKRTGCTSPPREWVSGAPGIASVGQKPKRAT